MDGIINWHLTIKCTLLSSQGPDAPRTRQSFPKDNLSNLPHPARPRKPASRPETHPPHNTVMQNPSPRTGPEPPSGKKRILTLAPRLPTHQVGVSMIQRNPPALTARAASASRTVSLTRDYITRIPGGPQHDAGSRACPRMNPPIRAVPARIGPAHPRPRRSRRRRRPPGTAPPWGAVPNGRCLRIRGEALIRAPTPSARSASSRREEPP